MKPTEKGKFLVKALKDPISSFLLLCITSQFWEDFLRFMVVITLCLISTL